MSPLSKINNFAKTKDNLSNIAYGTMIEDADITIGIPIYGCNYYLKDCLDCIFSQSSNNLRIQIIISDNYES